MDFFFICTSAVLIIAISQREVISKWWGKLIRNKPNPSKSWNTFTQTIVVLVVAILALLGVGVEQFPKHISRVWDATINNPQTAVVAVLIMLGIVYRYLARRKSGEKRKSDISFTGIFAGILAMLIALIILSLPFLLIVTGWEAIKAQREESAIVLQKLRNSHLIVTNTFEVCLQPGKWSQWISVKGCEYSDRLIAGEHPFMVHARSSRNRQAEMVYVVHPNGWVSLDGKTNEPVRFNGLEIRYGITAGHNGPATIRVKVWPKK